MLQDDYEKVGTIPGGFLEEVYPPVIIHFSGGFSILNHLAMEAPPVKSKTSTSP